ncbi:diacylglycerol/lipid kinase family protein [Microbacterium amylolyticum]|uniref:Diacylglycerol kinase family enzyme n=1 Tax=Microbacterium amylolyticum TaxID=936337 RepID=A0ABS4ZJP2_9MICO|nr:diacylglycerol kinase family protein [Microbacterium amylolyticum]MBP2437515.1 diacylglycerol kinase family enzyme [Microbacterium amylolyticum]
MTTPRIGIVWNSSKTSREELEKGLAGAAESSGIDPVVEWFETAVDDPGYGAADAAITAGASVVVAAGGDGTVRLVAERVAEADDVDLAIAPLGTGNLLARNLEVPIGNLTAAFTRALTGTTRTIDLGWVTATINGDEQRHAFAVMAGFGIDAHMITETDDKLKDRAGWLAYVESLGRAVEASEVIGVMLTEPGKDPIEGTAHTLLIGNCGTVQGGITLLPDADPSDGELDILLLNADGIAGWLDTMRNMLWDNGLKKLLPGSADTAESSESTTHGRVTSLTIELAEPREFEVDGDVLGEVTRFGIEVQAGALRVR